jgi:hypothetical protein
LRRRTFSSGRIERKCNSKNGAKSIERTAKCGAGGMPLPVAAVALKVNPKAREQKQKRGFIYNVSQNLLTYCYNYCIMLAKK